MVHRNICFYYGKKLSAFVLSLLVLSMAVFYAARLAPGDPLVSYYGERAEKMSPQERKWAQEKLGLDAPIHVQYIDWLENAVQGDFGISYKYRTNVPDVIAVRIPNTLILGGIGFVLLFTLALFLGVLCAWNRGKWLDWLICKAGAITSCIPEFWLSLLLVFVFSVRLKWLPSGGAYSIGGGKDIADRLQHLVLPMSTVVISHLWYYAYMVRNQLLEEMRAEYVLLAKSKGLGKGAVLFGHCLRNIMPSYLSLMAISVSHILGGTYIVEMVFSYPGLGMLSYESARYGDYNLLMVLCILSGSVVILCSFLVQIITERMDPRVRRNKADLASGVAEVG